MIAVHLENGGIEVRKVPKPRRAEGFASIRLLYGGICNTDLELQRGYYGYSGIPGMSSSARLLKPIRSTLIGRRVVGEINLACAQMLLVQEGTGAALPISDGARNCEASGRISGDPYLARR